MHTTNMLTDLEIEQIAREEHIWAVPGNPIPPSADLNFRVVNFARRLLRQQHNIGKLINKET